MNDDGDEEAPARAERWRATHRISYHHPSGETRTWEVMLASESLGRHYLVSWTQDEWAAGQAGSWMYSMFTGKWHWRRLPLPDHEQEGEVTVEELR